MPVNDCERGQANAYTFEAQGSQTASRKRLAIVGEQCLEGTAILGCALVETGFSTVIFRR